MKRVIIEYIPENIYQQGGKTLTNADVLTGNYATKSSNPNVEVEDGEYTKNSQTGQVQEVVGKKHIDGGEKVSLPDQSKVLSDYTKIGAENAKKFSKMFEVNVKATDTFATVLDKFNSKIGVKKLEAQEKELLEKLESNTKSSIDKKTKQINEDFLAEEIKEVNKKKQALNELKAEAFEAIFQQQELIPKKGNGTQILDKSGNPIKQDGGMVDDRIKALAAQYGMSPEQAMQILQEGARKKKQMYQEGGQMEQMAQAVMQQLQSGASPDEVITQLIQQGVPHEQAMQLVQGVMQQSQEGQPQMRYGGMYHELPKHQVPPGTVTVPNQRDPYYQFPTQIVPPTSDAYTYTGSSILNQPTLSGVEYIQPQRQGVGFGKNVQDVEKTISTHPWYFTDEAKKKGFREAIKRGGAQPEVGAFQKGYNEEITKRAKEAGLNDAEIANLIKSTGFTGEGVQQFDEKFGAFTSTRPLIDFTKIPAKPAAPEYTGEEPQGILPRRDVVKNVIYEEGMPYIMPPSAPIAPYLQQVSLSRLEGKKGSVENRLQASENARQAAYEATKGLPPAQAAAMMANYLATSGQQDTEGIAAQEMQDLQNKARIEEYNAGKSDKESLLNDQLKKQYEREAFATLNTNEQNWRNYYDAQDANRQALSDKIERRNIMNLGLENYQLNGSGGFDFVNQSPFQGQDPQAASYLKWFNTLTPDQQVAERKKQYELMSKKA